MRNRRQSKFKYNRRDAGEVKSRAKQDYSNRDGFVKADINIFTPKEGENYLRVLPPTWGKPEHYGLDIHVHYQIGPEKGNYLCLAKMKNQACPICEEMERAYNDNDEDYAKKLRPTKRVLMYVVDRGEEDKGVLAWPASWTIDRDLCLQAYDDKTGETLMIDDPEEGYDVTITRIGKGMNTKYPAPKIARRQSVLGKEEWLTFIQENTCLDILNYFDYDHIAKVFKGISKETISEESKTEKDDEIETYDDLLKLDGKQLDELAEKLEIEEFLDDYDSEEEFREAIAKNLDIEVSKKPKPLKTRRSFRDRADA